MTKKTKLNELAKDLNVSSNDVVSLIENKTGVVKKTVNTLSDEEKSIVLSHLTKQKEAKSFDEFSSITRETVSADKVAAKTKAKTVAKADSASKVDANADTQTAPEKKTVTKKTKENKEETSVQIEIEKSALKKPQDVAISENTAKATQPKSARVETAPVATAPVAKETPVVATPAPTGTAPATPAQTPKPTATYNRPNNNNNGTGAPRPFNNNNNANTNTNPNTNGQPNANRTYNNNNTTTTTTTTPSGGTATYNRPNNNYNRNTTTTTTTTPSGGTATYNRPNNNYNNNRQNNNTTTTTTPSGGTATYNRPNNNYNNNRPNNPTGTSTYNNRPAGGTGTSTYNNNNTGGARPYNNNSGTGAPRPYNNNGGAGGARPYNNNGGAGGARPYNNNGGAGGARPYNNNGGGYNNNRSGGGGFDKDAPARQQYNHTPKPSIPLYTKQTDGPMERVVRHVDTKTVDINLDKFNPRYEQLGGDIGRRNETAQRKQKLSQRSHQKNKQKLSSRVVETESQKMQRLELERARKQQLKITVADEIIVSELAAKLKVNVSEVIKKLIPLGIMAAQNEVVDFDTAQLVAEELGAKIEKEVVVTIEERLIDDSQDIDEDTVARVPIVVVMGHVDHGKTSLLDKIRNANVTGGEAGGITQHIGAYKVQAGDHEITFLDTPGHAAFTSMRARGASVTDIAILVVAADDGIMPQTVEAINHAKAAGVKIIVAINKIDKQSANVEKVKQELTQHELVPEEWGGDVICCPVSAVTGEGIPEMLEMINLISEVSEYKANPNRLAKGTVIEAKLDKGRGPVATLLVQNGTLKAGDAVIAGTSVGRVRAMVNDKGETVETAGPSYPVEITGLDEVPSAGDIFNAVEDEKLARTLVEKRKYEQKEEIFNRYQKVTLDNLFSQIALGEIKELPIIVKADVQGSTEAVRQSLEKLSDDEVRVRVIHGGVGAINNSDLMLAQASGAIIIGFNVRPDAATKEDATNMGIKLHLYRIIYDAIDDVKDAMKGMLDPKTREVELGTAEVRSVFKITGSGEIAGCYVTSGKVVRSALIRLIRDGIVLTEDKITSLKRFKDDQKEVAQGYECGIGLEKFVGIKEGDVFESFIIEEYRD